MCVGQREPTCGKFVVTTDRCPVFHLESNIRRKTHPALCEHDPPNTDGLVLDLEINISSLVL